MLKTENTKRTLQEFNDQAVAAVLPEETDAPQIGNDELTDENKAFIKSLLDKANYKDILDDIKDHQQKLIQDDLSIPIPKGGIIKLKLLMTLYHQTRYFFQQKMKFLKLTT